MFRRGNEVWDSGVKNIRLTEVQAIIYLPEKAQKIIKALHKKMPNLEVGFYLKGEVSSFSDFPEIEVFVSEEFYVPKQEVSAADIKFKEPPPSGFNGVIHKHPAKVKSFSTTDWEYINSNFEFSILFEPSEGFTDAVVRYRISENTFLFIPAKVEIIEELPDISEHLHKIEEKKYTPHTYRGWGIYRRQYDYEPIDPLYPYTYKEPFSPLDDKEFDPFEDYYSTFEDDYTKKKKKKKK